MKTHLGTDATDCTCDDDRYLCDWCQRNVGAR
jgi:hypothetical protein